MANEEVLGPRKTMFVLVIVVGCFAVLWPRILSPLILGHTQEQLKPNKFDREAGCCEVLFESEVAVLELINEVCNTVVGGDVKMSPYAAAECRKSVNETCGLDIAAFLKRSENVGKTTKMLLDIMKNSNSSCLKEHFGVPVWSVSSHQAFNSWMMQDTLKQERPPIRGAGPHPALRERGRAIPPGAPAPQSRGPSVSLPPHVRVRSSPLSGYFELDIKPPPIPGMRPPLGSPGGPVPAPKSSMGFVMPIYTICIIVFFVYTLSKILFKRTGVSPYDSVSPDPQFRRRVFRDDSRSSPDKLGPKERDTIVTAISGLVAEVQQQMEASYAQNQQRQELQDNHTRPYTNGTILHNSGPVHIVASEYKEPEEKVPESQKEKVLAPEQKETFSEANELMPETETLEDLSPESLLTKEPTSKTKEPSSEFKEPIPESIELPVDTNKLLNDEKEISPEDEELSPNEKEISFERTPERNKTNEESEDKILEPDESIESKDNKANEDLIKLTEDIVTTPKQKDSIAKLTEEFLNDTREDSRISADTDGSKEEKRSTPELLEEAIKEYSPGKEVDEDDVQDNASVKVLGMEMTTHAADGGTWRAERPLPAQPPPRTHEAEDVKSIFLETEIPQQSRVLVAEFAENTADRPVATKHAPMVVSGKMTLSLIQDAPRDTPERDPESTVDDFTTASAMTQPAAEKEEELSDEEIEEEIEIEEIEEEVEEEEEEELPNDVKQKAQPTEVPHKDTRPKAE